MNILARPTEQIRKIFFLLLFLFAALTFAQNFAQAQHLRLVRSSAQTGATAANTQIDIRIAYELGMSRPTTHLYEVTMTATNVRQPFIEVQFPTWVPGAYRTIDAARNVQEFRAGTTAGQTLPFTKTDTKTWRVETRGNSTLRVGYQVYADQLNVSGIHLDDTHAYFNGALLFPYIVGAKDRPVTLTINKPPRWATISTGLESAQGRASTFPAPDYDTFIDAPTEIGNQNVLRFNYQNIPYEIAIYGNHNYDLRKFQSDVESIVQSQVNMFGGAPYRRYVFIFHMTPSGGGGLEHLNSTSIGLRKYNGATEDGLDRFRGVTSHEFFHLWNVKRIRPDVLGPFNYAAQVPTRYLYISEGMTSYYGDLHILRSGVWTPEKYYKQQASQIQTLQRLPGRRILSVEESSINTWYTPDNSANNSFSYYTKGDILGMLLDLEIRQRTKNSRSLDDVFLLLYEKYALPKPGFPPGGFEAAVEEVAGSNFKEFFAKYVNGTEELPYERILAYAGLRLERKNDPTKPDLGITFPSEATANAIGINITGVSSESPAYNVLAPNDVILAVGGERTNATLFPLQVARFREGERVPMTIFRGDRLLEVSMTLVARPTVTYAISEDPSASAEQRALRAAWLIGKRT
ncbi:MAG: M61 family metallopeptidase [Pyrinomonadaceae bacterium]|nr:M61 family metallopeptidase [Pyrinomonadaceae bacterium]